MSETEDVPPADIPSADFVAWMSKEAPELATAGRRMSRRRSPKILGERVEGPRFREHTVVKVLFFVIVLAVLLSLPFVPGWLHHPDRPAPSPTATTAAEDAVFPATLSNAAGTFDREAFSDPGGCTSTDGVSEALAQTVAAAGKCEAIRVALYVDARTQFKIAVCVIVMETPEQAVGLMPLIASPEFGFIAASRQLPPGDGKVYSGGLTGGGRTVVLSIGEYFRTSNPDTPTLMNALQAVNTGVARTLGLTPPSS